jgi:hypothetical protein
VQVLILGEGLGEPLMGVFWGEERERKRERERAKEREILNWLI